MENIVDTLGLWFLTSELDHLQPYKADYNLPLVLLSYLFAVAGSYVGLMVSQRVAVGGAGWERTLWLISGAAAMGGGVWSMHFVGMLAYELPFDVGYDIALTALSVIPAIGASLVALFLLSRERVKVQHLALGGILTGAGIGAMHFLGMAAMRAETSMGYDPVLFALSVIVAVILATVALGVKSRIEKLHTRIHLNWANSIGAAIMGLAISGMHYTAMTAVTFYPGFLCAKPGPVIDDGVFHLVANLLMFILIMIIVVAVTARKNHKNSAILRVVIDNSVEGFVVCDRNGIVTLFSPGAQRIFGYTQDEVIGRDISLLMPARMRGWHAQYLDEHNAMLGGEFMGTDREVVAMAKDDTEILVEVTISDVSIGREALFCATVRDISVRKQAELARQVAHDKLQSALDEQMRVNQMQRDFVTMASHEFRTPLAIIDGGAQRILRRAGELSEVDLVKRLTKIRGAVSRMQRLMESFLTSATTELGSIELKLKQCDLKEIVEKICNETETLTPSHAIDADVAELPPTIVADRSLVGQVVVNLLSNATKYSPDADRIEVRGWFAGGHAHISVRDFGVGIPPDEIAQVFGRFFRASTSSGIAGTGIGLNLTHHIVEQHGGTIDVRSVVGEGTTFTVHLPIGYVRSENETEPASLDVPERVLDEVG